MRTLRAVGGGDEAAPSSARSPSPSSATESTGGAHHPVGPCSRVEQDSKKASVETAGTQQIIAQHQVHYIHTVVVGRCHDIKGMYYVAMRVSVADMGGAPFIEKPLLDSIYQHTWEILT